MNSDTFSFFTKDTVQPPQPAPVSLEPRAPESLASLVSSLSYLLEQSYSMSQLV